MKHKAFAKQVATWRASKKISQREAALLLGVRQRTFEGWEYGRTMPEGIGLSALLKRIS